jgi:hypothetical protein
VAARSSASHDCRKRPGQNHEVTLDTLWLALAYGLTKGIIDDSCSSTM